MNYWQRKQNKQVLFPMMQVNRIISIVCLITTCLNGQVCDLEPCSEADFSMKLSQLRAQVKARQGYLASWRLTCDFNNPQDYQQKKKEGEVKAEASLVENIIIFVETSYQETIKDSGGSVSESIISSIKTNTPRIPLTRRTFYYIKKDDNTLLVYAYVNKKNIEEGADRINLAFEKENKREQNKFRHNVASGNFSGALNSLTKIYAYSYSMVPVIGKFSGRSMMSEDITTELRTRLSNLELKYIGPKDNLMGLQYLSTVDHDFQVAATYNGKPVSGLALRARMIDGLSDWEDNTYKTMKLTNNKGHSSFRLGRILSKQTVQRIVVELDFETVKRELEKVSNLRAFLNRDWYDDFEELKKTGFKPLEIPIQIDYQFEVYISTGNIRIQAIPGMDNLSVKKDFEQAFITKKGVKLVSRIGENTLALKVDADKDFKTGKQINLTTSFLNRRQELRAQNESRITVRSLRLDWDSEVKNHVVALLDNLDKGDVRIVGDDGIRISVDRGKTDLTITGRRADIRLSYGPHSFSFRKLGFWQRDTTITVYQPLHEFPVELQKKDIQVVLGLPYPERDFNLQIRSVDKKRSKYTLNFEGNQLSYSRPERIYRNNIIHLPEDGNYAFTFKTRGKKNDTIKRPLDGKRPFYHEINFEPFSFSEIARNSLVPGLNQLKMHYTPSGVFLFASAFVAVGFTIYSHHQSMEYLDQYRQAKFSYKEVQDMEQDVFDLHRKDAETKYDSYNRYRNWSLVSGGGYSVSATVSFLHAIWIINRER